MVGFFSAHRHKGEKWPSGVSFLDREVFLWSCTSAELGESLEMVFSDSFDLQAGQCSLESSSDLSGEVVIVKRKLIEKHILYENRAPSFSEGINSK